MRKSPAELQEILSKLSPKSNLKFNKIVKDIKSSPRSSSRISSSPRRSPNSLYSPSRNLSNLQRSPRAPERRGVNRSVSPYSASSAASNSSVLFEKPRKLSPNELLSSSRSSPQSVSLGSPKRFRSNYQVAVSPGISSNKFVTLEK